MKIIIRIDGDVVTAKCGTYVVTIKADLPQDQREIVECLYQDHIINELLEELAHEIL